MFLVIMAMFVTSMFVAAGFAAANGDLPLSGISKDRKQAYAAAEAGLNYYLTHLNQDDQYWTYCDQVPKASPTEPAPVNQRWNGALSDPRIWRTIPGTSSRYTIELLPTPGHGTCDVNDQTSMIDTKSGIFRIRATGEASKASGDRGERRSVVASFRRSGFLDYLWFTDFEDSDPQSLPTDDRRNESETYCANKYRPARTSCPGNDEVNFASGDYFHGPMHTNDSMLVCGTPTFGRDVNDKIEVQQYPNSIVYNGSCSGTAKVQGVFKSPAEHLTPPASNHALRVIAQNGGDLFTGKTFIQLLMNGTMNVTSTVGGVRTYQAGLPMPADGVIYVQNDTSGSCTPQYPSAADYTEENTCGNVYVSGYYGSSLTIGADNDIIVAPTDGKTLQWGNSTYPFIIDKTDNDAVLGLIANNFVRVGHPVTRDTSGNCTGNATTAYNNKGLTVTAAILSLQHSWIVDNYSCGAVLGNLHVNGAIAQRYRGPVGTVGPTNGFVKDYWYDDRLKYRSPPHFLNPIDSAWGIVRSNEQVATPGNG